MQGQQTERDGLIVLYGGSKRLHNETYLGNILTCFHLLDFSMDHVCSVKCIIKDKIFKYDGM